jgi:hypothetical protein
MSHLPTERLAALVDEAPTPAELAHLASCDTCARERTAHRAVAELAATEAGRLGAPLTTWDALRPALVADGVIDDGRGLILRARHASRPWLQAAAAVVLLAGGIAAGRWSAHAPVIPSATNVVATSTAQDSTPVFRTIQDARDAQTQSQTLYQTATAYLAQHDTAGAPAESPSAIRTRLAALERTQTVMGEALNEAPYDPVINGYYLTTVGQREATMRRLNAVLPAAMKNISY